MPDELNASSIAESIGNELFSEPSNTEISTGADESQNSSAATPGTGTPPVVGSPANPAPVTQQQLKALPKAWKKEMEAHWGKLPSEVHDYVYEREENMMRGIQQYGEGYNRWNETIKPFQEVLAQNPNVNPVQLMQNVMHNHLRMLQADPAGKVALAKQILQGYGIPLEHLVGQTAQPGQQEDPRIAALQQEIAQLRQGFQSTQQQQYQRVLQEQTATVESFFKDPANEFAEEVGQDILNLLQTGAAKDLADAYQKAIWLNPTVRAKVIAKQQADAGKPSVPTPVNVSDSGNAKPRARKAKDWQSEIDDIVSKHYPTH